MNSSGALMICYKIQSFDTLFSAFLKRYENGGQIITSNSPGRKPRKANVNLKKKIQRIIENDPNIHQELQREN